jgi:hypothetical protein
VENDVWVEVNALDVAVIGLGAASWNVVDVASSLLMKQLTSQQDINHFIALYDTFLLDCDGVLWHGNSAFPGTSETLDYLRSSSIPTSID